MFIRHIRGAAAAVQVPDAGRLDDGFGSAQGGIGSACENIKRRGLMAVRKAAQKYQSEPVETTSDLVEQKVVAFAEQLGLLVGTVQAKAEGWLDRKTLSQELGRIRDSAAELFDQVNRGGTLLQKTAAKQTATSATRPSRGPVDAPGKRHRKPLPQERIDKQMGEPRGKQMGQKSAKNDRRGRR